MSCWKKNRKNHVKVGPGTLQSSILESFGGRLGAIGALLGACLVFFARSGALLGRLLGLMGASDLIWVGFGMDFKKVLGGLGRILQGFWKGFARIL